MKNGIGVIVGSNLGIIIISRISRNNVLNGIIGCWKNGRNDFINGVNINGILLIIVIVVLNVVVSFWFCCYWFKKVSLIVGIDFVNFLNFVN